MRLISQNCGFAHPSLMIRSLFHLVRASRTRMNPSIHVSSSAQAVTHSADERVDLSFCSKLERLHILVNPEFVTDERSPDMLKAMLKSWSAEVARPSIFLRPHVPCTFTRHKFGELLHKVGPIIEEWSIGMGKSSKLGGQQNMHGVQSPVLRVDLWDWQELREGWVERIRECFPTLARFKRLRMSCVTRE